MLRVSVVSFKNFNLTIFKKQIQDQRKIEQKVYRFYIYASVSL